MLGQAYQLRKVFIVYHESIIIVDTPFSNGCKNRQNPTLPDAGPTTAEPYPARRTNNFMAGPKSGAATFFFTSLDHEPLQPLCCVTQLSRLVIGSECCWTIRASRNSSVPIIMSEEPNGFSLHMLWANITFGSDNCIVLILVRMYRLTYHIKATYRVLTVGQRPLDSVQALIIFDSNEVTFGEKFWITSGPT